MRIIAILLLWVSFAPLLCADEIVHDTAQLVAVVRHGASGAMIKIVAGTYELDAPLEPKAGTVLQGAGLDQAIITQPIHPRASRWLDSERDGRGTVMWTVSWYTMARHCRSHWIFCTSDRICMTKVTDFGGRAITVPKNGTNTEQMVRAFCSTMNPP